MSFSPLSWNALAYISLCPLLLEYTLLKDEEAPHLTYIKKGFLFGFIFMGLMHIWFLDLRIWSNGLSIMILWLSYSLLLGLYYSGLFFTISLFRDKIWLFPFLWTSWEWIRSVFIFGNPTGSIGYSQARNTIMLQQASIGGVFWISFLMCTINLCLFLLVKNVREKKSVLPQLATLGFISIFIVGYGYHRLHTPISKTAPFTLGFIQANHQQKDKLTSSKAPSLRSEYLTLSRQLLKDTSPSLILFPETITTEFNTEKTGFMYILQFLATQYNTAFLIGTPTYENKEYYNSMALVTPNGLYDPIYHKQKLMPFGEYWPMKSLFKWVSLGHIIPKNEYSPGKAYNLKLENITIGSGICLESLYPWYLRQSCLNGADFIAIIANNAWFLNSSAAMKHLNMGIFRAVENNRYLIQAANTGISAIINPKGQFITESRLNEQITASSTIYLGLPMSIYTKFGNWIIYICFMIIVFQFNNLKCIKLFKERIRGTIIH